MILYSGPNLSDFYTLSHTKLLENHTLHSSTYPYTFYMRFPPPPLPRGILKIYTTGGPTYFFGSKISTLGIFLGQEIRGVFFWRHTDFISSLTQNRAEEDYV